MGISVVAQQTEPAFTQPGEDDHITRPINTRVERAQTLRQIGRQFVHTFKRRGGDHTRSAFINADAQTHGLAILREDHFVGADDGFVEATIGIKGAQTFEVGLEDDFVKRAPARPRETSALLGFDDGAQFAVGERLGPVEVECGDAYGIFVMTRRRHHTTDEHRAQQCNLPHGRHTGRRPWMIRMSTTAIASTSSR